MDYCNDSVQAAQQTVIEESEAGSGSKNHRPASVNKRGPYSRVCWLVKRLAVKLLPDFEM